MTSGHVRPIQIVVSVLLKESFDPDPLEAELIRAHMLDEWNSAALQMDPGPSLCAQLTIDTDSNQLDPERYAAAIGVDAVMRALPAVGVLAVDVYLPESRRFIRWPLPPAPS